MARKKRTALPRVTLLAYSRRELLRFSEAAEQMVACSNASATLLEEIGKLAMRLAGLVDRLEARVRPAKKGKAARPAAETTEENDHASHAAPRG